MSHSHVDDLCDLVLEIACPLPPLPPALEESILNAARAARTEAERIRAAVDNAVQATIARLTAEHEADRVQLVAKHAEEVRRLEATIASQGETIKMLAPKSARGQS